MREAPPAQYPTVPRLAPQSSAASLLRHALLQGEEGELDHIPVVHADSFPDHSSVQVFVRTPWLDQCLTLFPIRNLAYNTLMNNQTTAPMTAQDSSKVCSRSAMGSRFVLLFICVVSCLLLELFVFNFNYWRTLGATSANLLSEPAEVTAEDPALTFDSIPGDTDSIKIDLAKVNVEHSLVTVELLVKDEGNSSFCELGHATMTPSSPLTEYLSFNSYGNVKSLKLQFDLEAEESLVVKQVTANPNYPFVVSKFRIVLYALITAFVFLARKKGLRSVPAAGNEGLLDWSARLLMVGFAVLASAMLLLKPIYVGIATPDYNQSRYEGNGPFSTFVFSDPTVPGADRYHIDRYYELAKALVDGQLSLEIEPPRWLSEIDNPYDVHAREAAAAETGEEYKWDIAYYEGRYYLYFGIVPCLLLYVPMYLATGMAFPAGIAVLMGVIGYGVGLIALFRYLARMFFYNISIGSFLLVCIGALASSGLLYALLRATQYLLPMVWGLLFAVWGMLFLLKGCVSLQRRYFLLSGLFLALVFGCRPQLGILILFVVPAYWCLHKRVRAREACLRSGIARSGRGIPRHAIPLDIRSSQYKSCAPVWSYMVCFVIPMLLVGLLLAWYNAARFGSPFDFGANYNLTTNDMTHRSASLGLIAQGIFFYLLQPPNMAFEFPYLFAANAGTAYLGVNILEPTFGGALVTLPFLWGSALGFNKRTPWSLAVSALCVMGVIVTAFDSVAAGVLGRYVIDFCPFFACAAAIGFMVRENEVTERALRNRAQLLLAGSVLLTLAFSFLLFLAFFSIDGGFTVGASQFDPEMWGRLCGAFGHLPQ